MDEDIRPIIGWSMEGNAQRLRGEHLEAANWKSFVRDLLETSTDMVAKLGIGVSYFAHLDPGGSKVIGCWGYRSTTL